MQKQQLQKQQRLEKNKKLEFSKSRGKMGKYFRKCKGIGEIAVMEVSPAGLRTPARTISLAPSRLGKRKRSPSGEFSRIATEGRNSSDSARIPADRNPSPDPVLTSRCSSNASSEIVQERLESQDLGFQNVDFDCRERSETAPSFSNPRSKPDELESTGKLLEANSRSKKTAGKMPSMAEIEEFFSGVEKDEKKRFAEKYNFDVEKEAPLEGRYEWVRLK